MKHIRTLVIVFVLIFASAELTAQYGYGNPYGRRRSTVPQVQSPQEKPEPPTIEEMVEQQMPKISETLELNEFENAVVSSILTKYLKKRRELILLELGPEKTKEGLEKIREGQNQEFKESLPEEKYELLVQMQKEGMQKTKRKKKKEKRKKEKDN